MKKVGIYTIHADHNFGAMLQSYATEYFIKSNGYQVELVNYFPKTIENSNKFLPSKFSLKGYLKYLYTLFSKDMHSKKELFNAFHRRMTFSKRYYTLEEFYSEKQNYDIHLVGSDQVWNLERGIPERAFYFLDFLGDKSNKISYASSMAVNEIPVLYKDRLQSLLSTFKFLGIREDIGCSLVNQITAQEVQHVVDPTFLIDKDTWFEQIGSIRIFKHPYILYYGFDRDPYIQEMLYHAKKVLGIKTVIVTPQPTSPFKADKIIRNVGPLEFLNLIRYADLVIASSFHGVAFSLNFNVNFIALRYKDRNSRVESLLRVAGLSARSLSSLEEFNSLSKDDYMINFQQANIKMNRHVVESKRWLLNALQSCDK